MTRPFELISLIHDILRKLIITFTFRNYYFMKKTIYFLCVWVCFYNCKSIDKLPNCVVGVDNNYVRKVISKDSIAIITPDIEISKNRRPEHQTRKASQQLTLKILSSFFNKSIFYDVALMHQDRLTINKALENRLFEKYRDPKQIVLAPKEILIDKKKYSILISITGEAENNYIPFLMQVSIINNHNKTFELVDRYRLIKKPLNTEELTKTISLAVEKITKTP